MKILYDHQAYDFLNFGGIPRYFYELTKGLTVLNQDVTNTIKFSENIFAEDRNYFKSSPFFLGNNVRGRTTLKRLLNQRASIKSINKKNYDIFHPTYYSPYFLKSIKDKPFVVTVYDLIHELYSDKYEFLAKNHKTVTQKKEILKHANQIISISETTKNDLINIYNIDPDKIKVIGLGNSMEPQNITVKAKGDQEYLLYVGNRVAWKNFVFCIEAIAPVIKSNNLLLVCAGGGDFTSNETELINKLGLSNYVKYEPITDSSLVSLYYNAFALILPSLYEGFGIPVLEAFACGCPCLLSEGGSLPEVGGDAALYFDPTDADSIQSALSNMIADSFLRDSIIAKGKNRLKHYTWDITCQETLQVYKDVIS
jgi:glycosyltransferase involved in cell wall biosynthesis